MLSVDMLDLSGFTAWTIISRIWAFVAATFIIIVPLVQEVSDSVHVAFGNLDNLLLLNSQVRAIWRQVRTNKQESQSCNVANGGDAATANGNAPRDATGGSKQGKWWRAD